MGELELLAGSPPEALSPRPSQLRGVLSGLLHRRRKRVTVLFPIFCYGPANAILAVLLKDPAQRLKSGAVVVEKCRESLAARGTKPPLNQVNVLLDKGQYAPRAKLPIAEE